MPTRFTISHAGGSSTQEFSGAPEKVIFEDLQPGEQYTVTAELYYDNEVIDTDIKTFSTPMKYITDAFYLLNETDEDATFTLTKNGTPLSTDLSYSLDNQEYETFDLTLTTNTVTVPGNGKIFFRSSTGFSKNKSNYFTMNMSQQYSVHGNIQCLHNYLNLSDLTVTEYEFYYLFFRRTNMLSAEYLYMPATTLASGCYYGMFSGCSSLKVAPELYSTKLADYCYQGMFSGCTALTAAPELPATTLADYCYSNMFIGCTALTKAPELHATTLTTQCYNNMFNGCTALTKAPELPATKLAEYCYSGLFSGCSALTEGPTVLPATTLAKLCYNYMFNECSALTVAPELPATTLAEGCYQYMFQWCVALKKAPELPATTLANNCYDMMFYMCRALQSVTTHVTEWNTAYTSLWLEYAGTNATNPTLYCPSDSTIPSGNTSGIPEGWTRADLVTN